MNGYRPTSSGLGSHGRPDNGPRNGTPSPTPRVTPHINDLKARAEDRLLNAPLTVDRMLEMAEQSTKQIDSLLDFRRPELAYLEYIVASELVFNRIPNSRDAPLVKEDRGTRFSRHKALLKYLSDRADRLSSIKEIIINDNKRSGVRPTSHSNGSIEAHARHASVPNASTTPEPTVIPNPRFSMRDELFLETSTSTSGYSPRGSTDTGSEGLSGRSTPLSSVDSPWHRPPANPKPQNMRAFPSNGSPSGLNNQADALSERFARLRASGSGPAGRHGSVQMPSPLDFNGMIPGVAAPKPQGPRAMPVSPGGPDRPPKLPLDTRMSAFMPKEPSPAYSPARNMQTPFNVDPPRTTARSLVRTNSIPTSSLSAQAPNGNGDADSYFPRPPSQQGVIRRKSLHAPREWQINAEKLFDYMKPYNVLVIDVRNREDYDDGHIYGNSIMCIEPTALRPNMSADQLQEALVLSPDIEQEMFDRRNEFDLVVYYDQSTASADFLTKSSRTPQESVLKYLYDALYEFNADKPLQRPPILLMGGLDAWADLLGQGALKTTNTAAIVTDQQQAKVGRPIRRVPVASNGSRLYLQKKRMRDYNPLDPEEERKWLEKARGERPPTVPPVEDEEEGTAKEEVPYYHSTEEFMRRFPDASGITPQSMTSTGPRQPSYAPPPRPPSRAAPALPDYAGTAVPSIPSRPPPAASRVNYSGAHDRAHPQNHVATARSSQLPAYLPPSQLPQNIRLPRTGLINFGVTCYMNATIQCLNATLPLTRIYKDGSFVKYIQKQNWRGSGGIMSENFATLIQNLWVEGGGPCRPKTLRELCARMNREWGLDRQQDAKEFFDFLVDILHEDMNVNWSHPPAQALTEKEEARRESLPKSHVARIEWLRWSMRERSIISELFGGQHMSRLRCTTCHFTSTTFETFYSISVEIPRDGNGNRPADIRDCLRSYCAEERLAGDEVWRCPRCKKEREATKQITLTRAPHYLVIHFKRFSASHTERARKVRTPIDFPLDNLDLAPFMLPPITPAEEATLLQLHQQQQQQQQQQQRGPPSSAAAAADAGAETLRLIKSDERMCPPYRYGAYAVMRHLGATLTSGHYVAMLKDAARGCWWQFNDSRVTEFQPELLRPDERLQNEQAYIVFYERERLFGGGR